MTPDPSDQPEPWEPNLTALRDNEQPKWKELLSPSVPVPTPWNKELFEQQSRAFQGQWRQLRSKGAPEEQLEELFRKERQVMTDLLFSTEYAAHVGAFEGAGYQARGLFRPTTDCVMFTRDQVGFCPVCQQAISRMIDQYSR